MTQTPSDGTLAGQARPDTCEISLQDIVSDRPIVPDVLPAEPFEASAEVLPAAAEKAHRKVAHVLAAVGLALGVLAGLLVYAATRNDQPATTTTATIAPPRAASQGKPARERLLRGLVQRSPARPEVRAGSGPGAATSPARGPGSRSEKLAAPARAERRKSAETKSVSRSTARVRSTSMSGPARASKRPVQRRLRARLQAAKRAIQHHDWRDARTEAAAVLRLDPQNRQARAIKRRADAKVRRADQRLKAARLAAHRKDWRRAQTEAAAVLRLDPQNRQARAIKKRAQSKIRSRAERRHHRPSGATLATV